MPFFGSKIKLIMPLPLKFAILSYKKAAPSLPHARPASSDTEGDHGLMHPRVSSDAKYFRKVRAQSLDKNIILRRIAPMTRYTSRETQQYQAEAWRWRLVEHTGS